jgi:hypothetical protein
MLNDQYRSRLVSQVIVVQLLVLFMLTAQYYAWAVVENGEYHDVPDHDVMLTLVKIPCIVALHFVLTPEVDNALKIMKFANNEEH